MLSLRCLLHAMTLFNHSPEDWPRLDWQILRDSPFTGGRSIWRMMCGQNVWMAPCDKKQVMKVIITLIVVAVLVIVLVSAIWKNRRL
jgi:hypothetical protein